LPKTRFLMLMRNEQLAALETSDDEASGVLSIIREGAEVARGNLGERGGVGGHGGSPSTRCAATEVNPEMAERDMQVRAALASAYGHTDMGVYAEVVADGEVVAGDRLEAGPA
jgi:uncharacterized protein YcbX